MTNKEYYGDGYRAKAEYDKLGNVSFVDWLNAPCKETTAKLPSWVKIGAVYWHGRGDLKFKITSIDYDQKMVYCTQLRDNIPSSTSFSGISNPDMTQHEPEIQIPEWMKVGARYFYPETRATVYTIDGIDAERVRTHRGWSYISNVLDSGAVEYKGWPSWLKAGDMVLIDDSKPQLISIVCSLHLRMDNGSEIDYTPGIKITRVPKIPEWMKEGAEFKYDTWKFKITGFSLSHEYQAVKVTGGHWTNGTNFSYEYIERFPERFTQIEAPKLPAWVKVGAWVSLGEHYKVHKVTSISDKGVLYSDGNQDTIRSFMYEPEYHEVVVTPWTTEQWLAEMRKGTVIQFNRVRGRIECVKEYWYENEVNVSIGGLFTTAADIARNGETESHKPCGTWKIKD